jgi:NuA3 HAT complex component NTO1
VQDFSRDFAEVVKLGIARINDKIDSSGDADIETINNQLHEVKPGTAEHHALSHEQKEIKKLSKRLMKAVTEMVRDAAKKEADLKGETEMDAIRKLESLPMFSAPMKTIENVESGEDNSGKVARKRRSDSDASAVAGASHADGDTEMRDADEHTDEAVIHLNVAGKDDTIPIIPARNQTPASKAASHASSGQEQANATKTSASEKPTEPLSPPMSADFDSGQQPEADSSDVFAHGGVPWYLKPFDPIGTTVHEERYTGREVLRNMSEELSDMDEDTLTELVPNGVTDSPAQDTPNGSAAKTNGNGNGGSASNSKRKGVMGGVTRNKKGKFSRRR